jgi:hypothetical protein
MNGSVIPMRIEHSTTVGAAHVARAQPVGRTHIRGLPHHELLTRSGSFFFRLSAADNAKRLARLGDAMEADHQRGYVKLNEVACLLHRFFLVSGLVLTAGRSPFPASGTGALKTAFSGAQSRS